MNTPRVRHYFDYKSPYAWLAQVANEQLELEFGIAVERLPYTLDIPSFLGRAELDASGQDIVGTRNVMRSLSNWITKRRSLWPAISCVSRPVILPTPCVG